MTRTTYRKIGLATLIMMASIFLSRLLGVLRESAIAALGGAGTAVDAYKTAFILPEILNHVVAAGFLSITFIPIFSRYLAKGDEAGGWRIFSTVLTFFGLVLCALIIVAMALAPQLVTLLTPGRAGDPLFISLAVRMTRIILPAQFFFFTGGLFMAVQFARERFFLPALAPLVYNLGIILGGIILYTKLGVEGFSWGALVGAFIGAFVIQCLGAHKTGMRYRFRLNLRHPDLKRYVVLTLPLIFGLTMVFSTEVFSKYFGSYLPPGGISWIDYAMRIMMMLVGFFGQAVGVASFPFLSKFAAEKRLDEMNQILNGGMRYLALMIPFSVLVWVLRLEIVRILLQRFDFTSLDTHMTALALTGMLIGATAFAVQTLVNRGFYAVQNTLLPAVFSTLTTLASIPLYWIGLKTMGILGIGLAISLAAFIQVIVVYGVWNRSSRNHNSKAVYGFYGKMIALSLPLGVVLWAVHRLIRHWIDASDFAAGLGIILILSLLFVVLMDSAARLFNIAEIQSVTQKMKEKLFKPGTGP